MTKARIIDGRMLSSRLRREVREGVSRFRATRHLAPGLAVVLAGNDAASEIYVRSKSGQCEEVGIQSFVHRLPEDIREDDLLTLIHGLNADYRINGILIQLPLPGQVDTAKVLEQVSPDKDVDGFHVLNAGRLATGAPGAMVPCTPVGCLMMIKAERSVLAGCRALVLGRSNIVGKPMARLLLAENCTVTVAHSKTRDLAEECRRADILVAAVGRPRLVQGDWIKPGAIVIDVGINRVESDDGKSKLVGDVDFRAAVERAAAITPVPGGVGPMTIACLLRNTLLAACRQHQVELAES